MQDRQTTRLMARAVELLSVFLRQLFHYKRASAIALLAIPALAWALIPGNTPQFITFNALSNKALGAAPFAVSATSGSGMAVIFSSLTTSVCTAGGTNGSTISLVGAGTCTIAANQPGGGNYKAAPQVTQSFSVLASQSITFAAIASKTYGAAPFAVSATASSGLAVTITSNSTGVCTVSGSTVTLVASGTCTLAANQAGSASVSPAAQVTQSFTVAQGSQSVTFPAIGANSYGATVSFSATASSGLPVTYSSSTAGICTVSGATAQLIGIGTCTIVASQAGNSGVAAAQATQSFAVAKANQSISFASLPSKNLGTAPFSVSATASSGLAVALASNSPAICTVSGSTVTIGAVGTCSLTASQSGNADYNAATAVTQTFTVASGSQTISFAALSGKAMGSAPFTVAASASSGLAVTFSSSTTGTCTAGGTNGSTISVAGVGTCTIAANQSGNASYGAAAQVTQSFAVTQGTQSISFPAIGNQNLSATPLTLNAVASSGLAVSYSSNSSTICSVSGNSLTMLAAGTCSITASQAGNANYSAATGATQSFTIANNLAGQSISFGAIANQTQGAGPLTLSATASSGLAVAFTSSTPSICSTSGSNGTTLTLIAAGTCTVAANQAGNTSYAPAAQATQSFTISAAAVDNATFASQTQLPTTMRPGQPYPVTIVMNNTGTTAWAANSTFKLGAQTPQDNRNWGTNARIVLTSAVAPGQQGTFTFSATAPSTPGTYDFQWKMVNEGTDWFGATTTDQSIVVATGPGPAATVSATPSNSRMSGTTPVTVTLTGSGNNSSDSGANITKLELFEDSGTGFGSSAIQSVTGSAASLAFNGTVNLGAGLYRFKLRATDSNNVQTDSTVQLVSVTNSVLLGQVSGIEVNAATNPQVFGWVCQSGNSAGLNYQVYANAPASLGGTLIGSGVANTTGQPDDTTVRAACGTPGSSHDFLLDLGSIGTQYGSSPIYVQAQDAGGDSIVLPCAQNGCTLPGTIRIGINNPNAGGQFSGNPAPAYISALISNGTPPYSAVNITVNGQSYPVTAESAVRYSIDPSLPPGSYVAIAEVQQGGVSLYSSAVDFTVVAGTGPAGIVLNNAPGTISLPFDLSATVTGTMPAGGTVSFSVDGTAVTTSTNPANSSDDGTWTQQWSSAAAGVHSVTASLYDATSKLITQSAPVALIVGGTPGGTVSGPIGTAPQTITLNPADLNQYLSQPDAGSLPGSLSVGNNGAATYGIPIAVPPGTAGLAPQLSLSYSSLAGNGIAGFGWSLGGTSSIHRCIRTVAQDGYAGPVNLAPSDALCLDGTRLMLVSGTYGATNATYRTEIDNFARITQVAGAGINSGTQPAFVVETKDGRTMYYGYDPVSGAGDSTAQAVGKVDQNRNPVTTAPALYWNLAKVTDRAGNAIVYHYTQDVSGGTGEVLLDHITYGTVSTQYNQVSFSYELRNGSNISCTSGASTTRSDADIEYVAGARADLRHRLTAINTYTDGNTATPVETTTLKYCNSDTSGRSMLQTAQVCSPANNNACLPATTFTWTTSPANSFVPTALAAGPAQNWGAYQNPEKVGSVFISNPGTDYQQKIASLSVGDFVGDGKQRILVADHGESAPAGTAAANPGWHIFTLNAGGNGFDEFDLPYAVSTNFGTSNATPSQLDFSTYNTPTSAVLIGDFDGDGRADVAFIDQLLPPSYQPTPATALNVYLCLSRMTAQSGTNTTGGFDCQAFDLSAQVGAMGQGCSDAVGTVYPTSSSCISPAYQTYQAMFLNTKANGMNDILLWNPSDVFGLGSRRCSYVPGSGATKWSWSCSAYPALNNVLNSVLGQTGVAYGYPATNLFWPTINIDAQKTQPSTLTSNTVAGAVAQRSYIGDYLGTGQSGFVAQRNDYALVATYCSADLTAIVANDGVLGYSDGTTTIPGTVSANKADLASSVVNTGGFATLVGASGPGVPTPSGQIVNGQIVNTVIPCVQPASSNQFVWTAGTAGSGDVPTVVSRYLVRESKGTEPGGSSLGDINGDGYTDYLMTFEGHAEICYSLGADGFDCHLMEDQTLSGWPRPTVKLPGTVQPQGPYNVSIGSTVQSDGSGYVPSGGPGQGVFSVLTTGHVSDSNLTEVIYRRDNGGGGPVGGPNYWVCTVRDGAKQCTPWSGPAMRPYIAGADSSGYPIPGVTYLPGTSNINWPTAGGLPGDYSGHGRVEILWYCNSNCVSGETQGWSLYTPNSDGNVDRLQQVVNGNGYISKVSYGRMADASVYTQTPTDGTTYSYPLKSVMDGGRMLATELDLDQGDGQTFLINTYQYEGLATDLTGRGEQGFERITVTNPELTVRSTRYAQGFPYTGMELSHKVTSSANILMEQTVNAFALLDNTVNCTTASQNGTAYQSGLSLVPGTTAQNYQATPGCANVLHPYVQISKQLVHADLNGTALPTSTATVAPNSSGVDAWGNVLTSTVQTVGIGSTSIPSQGDTYTTVTANQYSNRPTDPVYIIGQLRQTQVAKSSGSISQITRTKQYDYYGQATITPAGCASMNSTGTDSSPIIGLLMDEIAEPCSSDASLSLQVNYGHDGAGNVTTTTDVWQDTTQTSKPVLWRTVKTVVYDSNDRFPVSVKNALNQVETATFFDGFGAPQTHTDINGLVTTWNIDGFGRTTQEIRPDGTQTGTARKQCGGLCPTLQNDQGQSVTPQNILITRPVLASNPSQLVGVPAIVYADHAGHALRHETWGFDGTEIDTDQTYDSKGREASTYQPRYAGGAPYLNNRKAYDELNRVTDIVTDDELGNPQHTTTVYNGLQTQVTNPANETKTDYKDAVGQLAQSLDPANQPTNFTRDAFGDLTQTKDPKGNTVAITYDNLGRKINMVDPDLGTISYCLDPRGLLWQQISPIERANIGTQTNYCTQRWNSGTASATNFLYDTLDRMIERQEPDLDSHWSYDTQANSSACSSANGNKAGVSLGKLVEATSVLGNGTKDYDRTASYDYLGRPCAGNTNLGQVNVSDSTTYDAWNRPSSVTRNVTGDPAGPSAGSKTTSQFYNGYGYLAQIARTLGGLPGTAGTITTVLWETKRQDAGNRVLDSALGNNLFVNREYNAYTERLDDGLIVNGNTLVFHENYQYDVLGNVSNRAQEWGDAQSNNYSEAFSYDNLNRLITSTVFGSSTVAQSFGYDSIGNLTCKTGVGTQPGGGCSSATAGNYSYGSGTGAGAGIPGPHAVTAIAGIGNFTYDLDGNLTSGAGRSYSSSSSYGPWTSFDMPSTITDTASGNSSTFTYGPDHQRATQTRSDMTLYYAAGVEVDIPAGGSMGNATVKTYWPAGLGVEIDTNTGTSQRWTHDDRLGSITVITNETGGIVEEMPYDAWGNRRLLNNAAVTASVRNYQEKTDNKGFTGQEELDQLGLVHLNGRVYDPFVGRFLSADPEIQDPTHSQSYNRYTYVWNNPTNDTDPTGFEATPAPQGQTTPPPKLSRECTILNGCRVQDFTGALFGHLFGDGSEAASGQANQAADKTNTTPSAASGAASGATADFDGASACGQCGRYHPGSDPYVPPPQEGVEASFPEGYLIGTGGIVKSVLGGLAEKIGFTEIEIATRDVWSLGPATRGVEIEKALGQNLPANFPVIDRFENGAATSIKSIDLGAKTYTNTGNLDRMLTKYVDAVASFNGRRWAGVEVKGVTSRALEVAIPSGRSIAQQEALVRALEYGRSVGVNVKFIIIK